MHDLDTINKLIANAVEDSSYNTVVLSSCIFIVYTLIVKLVEFAKSKSRNRPILEMASAIKDISGNIVRLNAVLDKTFKEAEQKEVTKLRNVINIGWGNLKAELIKECNDVIIHNNVEANKDSISQNIYKLTSTEYYKLYSILSAYEINDVNVCTKLKEEWIDKIADECLSIIFNGHDTVSRIRQLTHKVNIITEEYSTYVINKTFNR